MPSPPRAACLEGQTRPGHVRERFIERPTRARRRASSPMWAHDRRRPASWSCPMHDSEGRRARLGALRLTVRFAWCSEVRQHHPTRHGEHSWLKTCTGLIQSLAGAESGQGSRQQQGQPAHPHSSHAATAAGLAFDLKRWLSSSGREQGGMSGGARRTRDQVVTGWYAATAGTASVSMYLKMHKVVFSVLTPVSAEDRRRSTRRDRLADPRSGGPLSRIPSLLTPAGR